MKDTLGWRVWKGRQAHRVCEACFGGNIEAMRSHARTYLEQGPNAVPDLGLAFRNIVRNQNRADWWTRALRHLEHEVGLSEVAVRLKTLAEDSMQLKEAPLSLMDPSRHSTYLESVRGNLFIADLQRDGILRRNQPIKVFRPDVDDEGIDVVLECNGIIRHVQIKSVAANGATREWGIHAQLMNRPSGCAVLIRADAELNLEYAYFGGKTGEKIPDLGGFTVLKHTKANSLGVKLPRPNLRKVPFRAFVKMDSIQTLSDTLFGPPPQHSKSGDI